MVERDSPENGMGARRHTAIGLNEVDSLTQIMLGNLRKSTGSNLEGNAVHQWPCPVAQPQDGSPAEAALAVVEHDRGHARFYAGPDATGVLRKGGPAALAAGPSCILWKER